MIALTGNALANVTPNPRNMCRHPCSRTMSDATVAIPFCKCLSNGLVCIRLLKFDDDNDDDDDVDDDDVN